MEVENKMPQETYNWEAKAFVLMAFGGEDVLKNHNKSYMDKIYKHMLSLVLKSERTSSPEKIKKIINLNK